MKTMKTMTTLLALAVALLLPIGAAAAGEKFACKLNGLTATQRVRHQELTKELLASMQEKKEIANGYAFRLPADALLKTAEWVVFEHKCCPFFTLEIEQTRDDGPVWLRLTGTEGVKAFIRTEFAL